MTTSPLAVPENGTKEIIYGIIIVCEDTNSNYYYLESKIKSSLPNAISLSLFSNAQGYQTLIQNNANIGHTNPRDITAYAIKEMDRQNTLYREQNDDEDEPLFFRELYCVVDVDDNISNGTLPQAYSNMLSAKASNPDIEYKMIVSNECFEIWYILHFQDITHKLFRGTRTQKQAGLVNPSNKIETVLKTVISWPTIPQSEKPENKKIKSYRYFFQRMSYGSEANAIRRAIDLINRSTQNQPYDNPSTELHLLIQKINSFKS